jgi:homoserine acetyltransferase
MVDVKKDHEMYLISVRALDSADARKLSGTITEISRYRIWEALASIDVPAIVIGASNDTFHSLDDSRKISVLIKGSRYIDLVTNDRSHGKEVYDIIRDWLTGR